MPESWNLSLITTLYKSGDPGDCNNYRGLSVTSCLGKLFNKLLTTRLNNYLESEKLLSHFQAGFRKGYRITDNIFILKTLMNKYLFKEKKELFVCFVDFLKAFDTVWRPALLLKILKKGIGGNFFNIIKHMYSTTKCAVRKGNVLSDVLIHLSR